MGSRKINQLKKIYFSTMIKIFPQDVALTTSPKDFQNFNILQIIQISHFTLSVILTKTVFTQS